MTWGDPTLDRFNKHAVMTMMADGDDDYNVDDN